MMEITVSYDDLTRTLGKPVSDYGGTTLDANSTKITVTGIPEGYSARLDFDVSIRVEGSKKKVSPYLPLDADGSCIVPGTIMRACKADLRLPVQLVLESSDKTETYASKNWLIFRVSPSINAFETVQDGLPEHQRLRDRPGRIRARHQQGILQGRGGGRGHRLHPPGRDDGDCERR